MSNYDSERQLYTIDFGSVESIAEAISDGLLTVDTVPDWTDGEVFDGVYVHTPGKWTVCDQSGYQCEHECDSGSWDDEKTAYHDMYAWRVGIDSEGRIVRQGQESHLNTVEVAEPKCDDEEGHDWQSPHNIVGGLKENPGVFGHGGGVITHEVCVRCGCGRKMDTCGTDPNNGEQWLLSVSYEPRKYSEELGMAGRAD